MTGGWSINVNGRIYGAFSAERMRAFVGEGRLAPHSLVAREGSTDWHEARVEPEFSDLFPPQNHAAPPFSSEDTGPAQQAAQAPRPALASQARVTEGPYSSQAPAPHSNASQPAIAHFAVIIDQKAQSGSSNIEGAIGSLGLFYRLASNVWIISTDQSVSAVRNRLVQELGKSDSLFVIDASRGKAAWFNFGPEADVRIRRIWQKTA